MLTANTLFVKLLVLHAQQRCNPPLLLCDANRLPQRKHLPALRRCVQKVVIIRQAVRNKAETQSRRQAVALERLFELGVALRLCALIEQETTAIKLDRQHVVKRFVSLACELLYSTRETGACATVLKVEQQIAQIMSLITI